MGIDRLDEILPNEPAPSKISQFGTEYVRREYFQDGSIIYLSPLDFVLNGPDEGEEIVKMQGPYTYKVKMGQRHYESGSNVPFMCEVFVSIANESYIVKNESLLWVVVEANETTVNKFKLRDRNHSSNNYFSLHPQIFIDNGHYMNGGWLGANVLFNEINFAFSEVTGISPLHKILHYVD